MNPAARLILIWYFGIFALAITSAATIRPVEFVSGICLSFIILIAYFAGALSKGIGWKGVKVECTFINNWRPYIFGSVISVVSSYYVTSFYTGNNIDAIILTLMEAGSSYNSYQNYTSDNNLTSFTISQIPAFLCTIFTKF